MTKAKTKTVDKTVMKNLGLCGCGMPANAAAVDVKDGRVVRIRPLHYDQNYTKEELRSYRLEKDGHVFEPGFKSLLPPLSLSYRNRTYSKNRVPYPLIREDWDADGERNPQNRGISGYRRIGWDEATDIIAQEIRRIHDSYGPFSIYTQGEGHGEAKIASGGHGCQIEMLEYCGGSTKQARQPDSWEGWYWGAKHIWGMDPLGQNIHQNGVFRDITENGDAVLYWGADPETTPWGWGGQQASRMCYWFNEIGIKSIFICPDVNYANAVHADKWIPVLPNTDAALQLAIAYVWITEDLYDKDYIATHAIGFDWFEQYVTGVLDGVPKTAEWAFEKCAVKPYTIKAFARYWAKHAVSIAHCNGGGYIRSVFSHEPARLEVALLGMQGVGKPGANQFKFIEWTLFGLDSFSPLPRSETWPTIEAAFHGWNMNPNPSFIPKTRIHDAILDGPIDWYGHVICSFPRHDQFRHFEYPLPEAAPIRMIWSDTPCWATCWNGGYRYQDAIRDASIEFILVQHPWMENDTVFADIVLPIRTMMECRDIATDNMAGQFALLFLEEQAVEPIGEAVSDFKAVYRVAKKLERYGGVYQGLTEKFTRGMTLDESLRLAFEKSGIPANFSYEDLQRQGFWASPLAEGWESETAGLFNFYNDPEAHPLGTPSGKIEYYSVPLAENFPDDDIRGPYPKWVEESDEHQERISSERARYYPFLLVSNHPRWRVHAQCDDIPWLREIQTCKVVGPDGYRYEPVWINPQDAAKYDIANGDVVKLFNERGAVLGGAIVSERIMPGALYQDHGSRLDSIVAGTGGIDRGGANNLIAPSHTTSKNAAGEVTNGFLVGIAKVDVGELAAQYPDQFNREYDPAFGLIASAYIKEDE
ncbi:MAG: molybdopterin-dependent oxidoreductase [Coriobacteriales bacterium]|nr:molybdopterin-dependent oxidoreductase [Coriobacteriales bacterium]